MKQEIIKTLEAKKEEMEATFLFLGIPQEDQEYGRWRIDGINLAIGLIEQMKDDQISPAALEKAGYDQPWGDSYSKTNGWGKEIRVSTSEVGGSVMLQDEDGSQVIVKVKHMAHLRALEEMFLS